MSKFEQNIEQKTEVKRKESTRREALGRYYYDLSKLIFVGVVIGSIMLLVVDLYNVRYYFLLIIGVVCVIVFATLGNKMFK